MGVRMMVVCIPVIVRLKRPLIVYHLTGNVELTRQMAKARLAPSIVDDAAALRPGPAS